MLTLFSIPKPFGGPAGGAQRNALASWVGLGGLQIVLVGDEPGVAEAAAAAGVQHLPDVACSEYGTPRLDDAFRRVDYVGAYPLRCFANSDVVFLPDLLSALHLLGVWSDRWVAVGRTCDLPLAPDEVGVDGWDEQLQQRASQSGTLRGVGAIDWLVFPRELYLDLPPFVVGRVGFDNWMIWHARAMRVPVVDLTHDVRAIHQSHDYRHLTGGKDEAYFGVEARHNLELAGGHLYTIADATHRLRNGRVVRNPWAFMRIGDRWRRVRWKLGLDRTP